MNNTQATINKMSSMRLHGMAGAYRSLLVYTLTRIERSTLGVFGRQFYTGQ